MSLVNKIIHQLAKSIDKKTLFKLKLFNIKIEHQKALKRIKKKDKINVVFFLIHEAVWKYEKLYHLLINDPRFNPIVLVCPYTIYGEENMKIDMENAYNSFKQKGYNVLKSLKEDGTWIDVKKELTPDIIFFTNPHFLTKYEYYINYYKDVLTCYVPYNFGNSHLLKLFHDQDFHNKVWKLFAETEFHKQYSIDIARNKGKNVVVTGFPGTDAFLSDTTDNNISLWKHSSTKKIIWAPHHTIDDDKNSISFSSFIIYHNYMLDILEKYKGKIEIIFKPHPLLKVKLYNEPSWGKEKTDLYFKKWEDHPWGGINEGEYIELFKSSDAMIHDSGSFLIEYLYTDKPVLRTDRDETITDRLNSFGKMAYNVHYIAKNKEEINNFIKNIIINQEDILKNKRTAFKQQYLLPPHNKTASENIYKFIKTQLK